MPTHNPFTPPLLTLMHKIEMSSMRLVPYGICISFNLSLTSSLTWLWTKKVVGKLKVNDNVKVQG